MNEQNTPFKGIPPVILQLAAWGFFALGLLCFFMISLMVWSGGVWACIIYVSKPLNNFLCGIASLFIWYMIHYGVHNTRNEWKSFYSRMILLAFSLTFSFLAGECIIRACYTARQNANSMEVFKAARKNGKAIPIRSTHPLATIIQPSDNQKIIYELQPHLDTNFGHKLVRTNSEGMRKNRDYPVQRPSNSVRILGIGDSGMFGWDVEQNCTFMDIMESNLSARQDGTVYETLNFAVPGYNTQQEVDTLLSKGVKYMPDIVIIGWCENDFNLPFFMIEKENYWADKSSLIYKLMFTRKTNRTEVAPGLTIHDLREYDKQNVLPETSAGSDVAGVKAALIKLERLGRENNFKVLMFGPMRSTICEICKRIDMPYSCTYDMIPDNKCPKDYLVHHMHPSPKGHIVLAEYLEKDLIKRGWLTAGKAAP